MAKNHTETADLESSAQIVLDVTVQFWVPIMFTITRPSEHGGRHTPQHRSLAKPRNAFGVPITYYVASGLRSKNVIFGRSIRCHAIAWASHSVVPIKKEGLRIKQAMKSCLRDRSEIDRLFRLMGPIFTQGEMNQVSAWECVKRFK